MEVGRERGSLREEISSEPVSTHIHVCILYARDGSRASIYVACYIGKPFEEIFHFPITLTYRLMHSSLVMLNCVQFENEIYKRNLNFNVSLSYQMSDRDLALALALALSVIFYVDVERKKQGKI